MSTSNVNPNQHLSKDEINMIKKRHLYTIIVASIVLVFSIAGMICIIWFLK